MTGIFFEVLAKNQERLTSYYSTLFGWKYKRGGGEHGFYYVENMQPGPIRGGIGFAREPVVGSDAAFYIMVEDVDLTFDKALELGGTKSLSPTGVDGYYFAEFLDPEGNRIGLVAEFPPT